MVKFSQAIKLKNNLLTTGNAPVINGLNQAVSTTSDLNANYKQNSGLVIKLFNYMEDPNNEYLDFIEYDNNNYLNFFINLMNKPRKNVTNIFNDNNQYSNTRETIEKNMFQNLIVFINKIQTAGIDIKEEINNKYNNQVEIKNTQGSYPSLILTLMSEQLDFILRNNLAKQHYKNKIPIMVPYGFISPYTLFKKLLYDTTRDPKSYILNFGPSNFDNISAMFNFYKLNEIRKINTSNKFQYVNSDSNMPGISSSFYNNYVSDYPIPNDFPHFYTEINYDEGNNLNQRAGYIANFNNYSFKYNINLTNKYIFYLGIDNDYGWTNATTFLQHIASEYYEILLPSYDITADQAVTLTKNNSNFSSIEASYNEYVNSVISNISSRFDENIYTSRNNNYFKVNNILQENIDYFTNNNNPKVIAIKIPYYQINTNKIDIGIGVTDAWHIVKTIIESNDNNIDLSNSNVFLQSYGVKSDKKTVQFLSSNSGYANITFGSNYDFLEKNFNDVYNETNYNKDILNGLYSIKSYNTYNLVFFQVLNTLYNFIKEQTTENTTFIDFSNNFDQFKFFECITLAINIALYIINTIKDVGTSDNPESLKTNIKIPIGENIFNSNKIFNYYDLAITQTYTRDGSIDKDFLFSDVISSAYNNGLFFQKSSLGYPFNRNPAFSLFRRDNKSPSQNLIDTKVKYNYFPEYMYNNTGTFKPIFINSDYDLINSLIFLVNSDGTNYTNYYNIYLDNYLKNTTVLTTSNEYITIEITSDIFSGENRTFDSVYLDNNNISKINDHYLISEILFGDDFTDLNISFQNNNNIEKVIIGRNIAEIPSSGFSNCNNLNNLNFILDSSCTKINSSSFHNCISLNIVKLPNSIETIAAFAFANCSNLTQLQLSNNLLSIGVNAFQNTKITTLEFQKINNIDYRAFYNCNDLSTINFNDTCTILSLNVEIFKECTNLESVTLCSSITAIRNECFFGCQNLNSINFDSNLTNIEFRSFKGCSSLQNVNLYNTQINVLQQETFANCSSLNSCILPPTVTEIQNTVFSNCNDLSYIIINGPLTSIANDIFENINHNVIIYYFSSKTNTSVFDIVLNKTLIDFDNTIQSYSTHNTYYPQLYIEKNSLFKLNDLSINFYIDNFIIPYDISIVPLENNIIQSDNDYYISKNDYIIRKINFSGNNNAGGSGGNIDTSGILGYSIKFGNDLCFNLVTNIIVLDNILNKPYIKYNGNRIQYILTSEVDTLSNGTGVYEYDENKIIDYGINSYNYNNIDISYIFINNLPSNPLIGNTNIKTTIVGNSKFFVNYYYVIDESYNYNIDYNLILLISNNTTRANLRIDNNYQFEIFNTNNITKAKLTLRFENDGNTDVPRSLFSNYTNASTINNSNFLFPIFSITDNSNNSTDLTYLNGPIVNQSYYLLNNNIPYYFTNRINSKILRSSELNITKSYNNYQKIFNQKNGNQLFKKEESWAFKRGLYANDYAELEIIFNYFGNCKDIINNKNNNIFTKDNSFGIFIDNATSSYTKDGSINFYNIGNFYEFVAPFSVDYVSWYNLELYHEVGYLNNPAYNYNDNVIHFSINNDTNIIMNGPKNLIIERNSYFEDFGVLYLDNITPSFEYYEFPVNTYNSNSINLTNGVYEISYSIYPNGLLNAFIDISRTIEIVDTNLYKPTIILGNSPVQTILVNNYPGNNLENYAVDYNNNRVPLFTNLINYDLSQIGTYYEYFYAYDSSGNYSSLTRTIDVSDNSFTRLEFRETNSATNIGFNIETSELVLNINNVGTLDFCGTIILDFKILHKESRDQNNFTSNAVFNYGGTDYYHDNMLDNKSYNYDLCFNDISNNITTNIAGTEVLESDDSYINNQLNINTIIPTANTLIITIPIVNKTNNPIGVFMDGVFPPTDSGKIFVYENNTNLKLEYGLDKTHYDNTSQSLNVYIKNDGLINKFNNKNLQKVFLSIAEVTLDYFSSFDHIAGIQTAFPFDDTYAFYKYPPTVNLAATSSSNIVNTSNYNIDVAIDSGVGSGFVTWTFSPMIDNNKILSFSITNLPFNTGSWYALFLDVRDSGVYGNVYETNEIFNNVDNNSDNVFIINYENNINLSDSTFNKNIQYFV